MSDVTDSTSMSVSYVPTQSQLSGLTWASNTANINWPHQVPQREQARQAQNIIQSPVTQHKTEEKKTMAKLIRYTVTDPDRVLADKKPEACILLTGTQMLNGSDEKGFLMDLAPKVAILLDAHNATRATVEYEGEKGDTKMLKPIRLGNLDVVVEVLKDYK